MLGCRQTESVAGVRRELKVLSRTRDGASRPPRAPRGPAVRRSGDWMVGLLMGQHAIQQVEITLPREVWVGKVGKSAWSCKNFASPPVNATRMEGISFVNRRMRSVNSACTPPTAPAMSEDTVSSPTSKPIPPAACSLQSSGYGRLAVPANIARSRRSIPGQWTPRRMFPLPASQR